ncbi:hypothetical protein HIMB11_03044 [Rhodobacteraceae bacterium HIMB11]|jgi:hypothetical protein|nr:hypothetical protein HIMB11_03044 [Rhodobacteraceae bacterium HIMB11]
MELRASVKINEGNFDDWKIFYDSYQIVRHRYVSEESVKKITSNEAFVEFNVTDLDGLTELSASQFVQDGENRLGVQVTIVE